MVDLTRNGVCYQLDESPYIFEWRGICWHFSSEPHRAKFIRNVRDREMWLDDSLSRRFKCTVHLPIVADVQLYSQIEKRGFYVCTNDGAEYRSAASVYVAADMRVIGVVGDA